MSNYKAGTKGRFLVQTSRRLRASGGKIHRPSSDCLALAVLCLVSVWVLHQYGSEGSDSERAVETAARGAGWIGKWSSESDAEGRAAIEGRGGRDESLEDELEGGGERDEDEEDEEGGAALDEQGVEDNGRAGGPQAHKWKNSRRGGNSSVPLPPLDDLRETAKIAAADLFVHRGNFRRLLPSANVRWALRNNVSFPDAGMSVLGRYRMDSCAVVGNSGALLGASFGDAIDSHSTVIRINQAPTGKFRRHVGKRTTLRLINTRWTNKYGDVRFVEEGLPLEPGVTLVVTRAKPRAYEELTEYLRSSRGDVKALYLSSRVISAARRLLVAYRSRLDEVGRGPYFGGSTPSSGYVALFVALQLCENVTVYGFGLDDDGGEAHKYHYFRLFTSGKKKNSMNRTHSFDAERELLRALHKAGLVQFCEFREGDVAHNRQCGKQKARAPGSKRSELQDSQDGFAIDGFARAKPRAWDVLVAEDER